jgi:hypothetical protein
MLYDVAFRPVLEQPTGKDAAPILRPVIEHDQLDKGAGFLRHFPLRSPFTGTQADDSAANADAFTRFQRDIANKAVALVKEAEHRHALLHRRDAGIGIIRAGASRLGQGARFGRGRRRFCLALAAGKQHRGAESRGHQRGFRPDHGASGVHA